MFQAPHRPHSQAGLLIRRGRLSDARYIRPETRSPLFREYELCVAVELSTREPQGVEKGVLDPREQTFLRVRHTSVTLSSVVSSGGMLALLTSSVRF